LAGLTTGEQIAIWAIVVSAAIAIIGIIGGIIKYFWSKRDSEELERIKKRLAELEDALSAKVAPIKTKEDAEQPLSADEKAEYDSLIAEAKELKRQAKKFKKDLQISIDAQISYASALFRVANYREAGEAYRAILAGHPDNAGAMEGLGIVLYTLAEYTEAEKIFENVLAIDEDSFGPDNPNVATDLNNLAILLKTTNRLSEAEPMYRRALKIDEDSFGPDHPKVATDLNNLAILLQDTNRLSEAKPMYRRALKILEESLGTDHPDTKKVRSKLEKL